MISQPCRVHSPYALDVVGARRPTRLDAQEIKAAVAHQDAAARAGRGAVRQPARSRARRSGPDGRPAVSRRAPIWEDVPDEKWNDWRWQLSHRVNDLEEIEAGPEPDRRGARRPVAPPTSSGSTSRRTSSSLIDPDDPNDPIRRQVIPLGREQQAFTAMMEDSLAEDRHSPVPGLVHRYPDRVLMLVTTQCASYCRYCTRSRIVGDPTQNFNSQGPRGPARLPPPDAAGPRRPDLAAATA